MNPSGAMCLGAVNTNNIILGDNAIAIDNTKTPAQIYINGVAYFPTPGSFIDFSVLIPSTAGFNPPGTLRIGTSNTGTLGIGNIKIDNTVTPSQIFANGVALPPVESPEDITQYSYYLTSDITGNRENLPVYFQSADDPDFNRVVKLSDDNAGFEFFQIGIYEIQFEADVNSGESLDGSVFLKAIAADNILNHSTGTYLDAGEMVPQSNIAFSKGESSATITFNVYTTEANSVIGVGTDMIGNITLRSSSFVKIRQIGIYT